MLTQRVMPEFKTGLPVGAYRSTDQQAERRKGFAHSGQPAVVGGRDMAEGQERVEGFDTQGLGSDCECADERCQNLLQQSDLVTREQLIVVASESGWEPGDVSGPEVAEACCVAHNALNV